MIEIASSHTFQAFWWGESLSPYEVLCLKSFIAHGHKVHLYTFDSRLKVPRGVVICDASELMSRDRFFTHQSGQGKGSAAGFANLFRYRLLAEKGGWWIDTDVVCLSSQIPRVEQFFAYQENDLVNNAVLFFCPQHPAILRCYARSEKLGSAALWGDTGPRLLTSVLKELASIDHAYPAELCYPVHYSDALDMLRPSQAAAISERIKSSLFLHLWNEQLRRNGIRKECLPPRGSVLRQLTDRHQVSGWTGEYDAKTLEYLDLKAELAACYAEIDRQKATLDSILSSSSWRLTAAMRSVARLFRSWRGRMNA
jgi:hypothetical protein